MEWIADNWEAIAGVLVLVLGTLGVALAKLTKNKIDDYLVDLVRRILQDALSAKEGPAEAKREPLFEGIKKTADLPRE